jgi:hypothetical protein
MARLAALVCVILGLLATREVSAATVHRWTWLRPLDRAAQARAVEEIAKVAARRPELVAVEALAGSIVLRSRAGGRTFTWPGAEHGPNTIASGGDAWDEVVTASLIVARDHFSRDELAIESDGDWLSWQDGRLLYEEALGRSPKNPGIAERAPGFRPAGAFVPPKLESAHSGRKRLAAFVIMLCMTGLVVLLIVPTKT